MSVEVKNYLDGVVEEELYADSNTIAGNTTSPVKVAEGTIRDGFDAVVVSVAVTRDADCNFFLKIKGKQHYPDGLNTNGLGGLDGETLLLVPVLEKEKWEIGFTNKSGSNKTLSWRFRIRLFKK